MNRISVLIPLLSLVLSTNSAYSAEPVYKVDTHFLKTTDKLHNGSEAESDAYNTDSSDVAAHPTFTEQAYLDFGNRSANVYLIAARHDGDKDVRYIESELERLNIDPRGRRLFIEQGDPYSANGAATVMEALINKHAPNIGPAYQRAVKNPRSVFSREFSDRLIFARVARYWEKAGGEVVNMDLAQNYQVTAIDFLLRHLEKEAAARFMRIELDGETFSFGDFQTLIKSVYAPPFIPSEVERLKDCCGTVRGWTNTFLMDNQVRNLVRERYMRTVLLNEIRDGDIILTHPVHMLHILNAEIKPGSHVALTPRQPAN